MIWFFVIWGAINIFAIGLVQYLMDEYISWDAIFIYPIINEWLEYKDYNKFGCWFVRILFTIVFLPYLILHFTALILFTIFVLAVSVIVDLIDKIFKKKSKR